MYELVDLEVLEAEKHHKIKDDQEAEWALQQIRNAEEEKRKWKEFYESRIKAVNDACDLTIQNMTSMLGTYFLTVPHKVTATEENYRLPSGKLVLKKQSPEYEKDDDQLIEWLKANGGEQFIKTKESVDWGSLKKNLTVLGESAADENGQVIPCIKVIERPAVFQIGK